MPEDSLSIIRVYSRRGCHLCEILIESLLPLVRGSLEVEIIDIDTRPEWREELAERFGCDVEVIFVTCDEDKRYRRIKERGNPRDAPKLADWNEYLAKSDIRPPAFEYKEIRT